ncbi:unnamed protein product [Lampetra planeri]
MSDVSQRVPGASSSHGTSPCWARSVGHGAEQRAVEPGSNTRERGQPSKDIDNGTGESSSSSGLTMAHDNVDDDDDVVVVDIDAWVFIERERCVTADGRTRETRDGGEKGRAGFPSGWPALEDECMAVVAAVVLVALFSKMQSSRKARDERETRGLLWAELKNEQSR